METRKVIVVDEVIERALSNICNSALKFDGLSMVSSVNAVKESVKEEQINKEEKGDV